MGAPRIRNLGGDLMGWPVRDGWYVWGPDQRSRVIRRKALSKENQSIQKQEGTQQSLKNKETG